LRHAGQLIRENEEVSTDVEKKERLEKGKNVQGRGRRVTENVEVIKDHDNKVSADDNDEGDNTLVESLDQDAIHAMQVLSGLKQDS
jgi:hypothetical protein